MELGGTRRMSDQNQADVVILGGGTGGYVAAIRAAQLGKSVVIVEKDKLGGTCLHRGCIPSKALLRSAEVLATMKKSETYGIKTSGVELDFRLVQKRKEAIVEQLHKGVQYLMKKNKIQVVNGTGRLMGASIFSPRSGSVSVEKPDGEIEVFVPKQLVLATGSRPKTLPGIELDGKYILSSDDALRMEQLPKSILIIGGGVIGVEWASMLNDFGVEVTLIEAAPRLVSTEDADISREFERLLKKRGVNVKTGVTLDLNSIHIKDESVFVKVQKGQDEAVELSAEKMLVSIGRSANVEGIGLENTNVVVDGGVVKVNKYMQTAESHIYAIGDMIGGLQLAHAASHEGITAVEHFNGEHIHPAQTHLIPRCIYTRPEMASVGWTEQEAKELGYKIKTGKFSFKAIGKALVYGEQDGFVKVIADVKTDDILGVHMIGPHVTDYISEAALAQLLNATPWEVSQTIHPHPTLTETLAEAMLDVDGRALSM
jgi:dihydrolipoamide dehydrogenase